jgi:hypothetical protein
MRFIEPRNPKVKFDTKDFKRALLTREDDTAKSLQ